MNTRMYEVYPIQNAPVNVSSLVLNIQTYTLHLNKDLSMLKKYLFQSYLRKMNISMPNHVSKIGTRFSVRVQIYEVTFY